MYTKLLAKTYAGQVLTLKYERKQNKVRIYGWQHFHNDPTNVGILVSDTEGSSRGHTLAEWDMGGLWKSFITYTISSSTKLLGIRANMLDLETILKCECGAEKCRTTHAFWCPKKK